MQANIELQIDELNLYGFSKKDAFYIRRAVEAELVRLIQQGELSNVLSKNTNLQQMVGESFNFNEFSQPEAIGKQIAFSTYNSITALGERVVENKSENIAGNS